MKLSCNVRGKDRKQLVSILGDILGESPVYQGVPTNAYHVGNCVVDRNGTITLPERMKVTEAEDLRQKLLQKGFSPEPEGFLAPEETPSVEEPFVEEQIGFGAAMAADTDETMAAEAVSDLPDPDQESTETVPAGEPEAQDNSGTPDKAANPPRVGPEPAPDALAGDAETPPQSGESAPQAADTEPAEGTAEADAEVSDETEAQADDSEGDEVNTETPEETEAEAKDSEETQAEAHVSDETEAQAVDSEEPEAQADDSEETEATSDVSEEPEVSADDSEPEAGAEETPEGSTASDSTTTDTDSATAEPSDAESSDAETSDAGSSDKEPEPNEAHDSAGQSGTENPDAHDAPETTVPQNDMAAIAIPRESMDDGSLVLLRTLVENKKELFKRALQVDDVPVVVTDKEISFPWFRLTGIEHEAEAYAQFIQALVRMAKTQTRVQKKPYDGDNDRFAMRILMVRMGMKGDKYALARKLMMKHLTGNSSWRYGTPQGETSQTSVQAAKKRREPSVDDALYRICTAGMTFPTAEPPKDDPEGKPKGDSEEKPKEEAGENAPEAVPTAEPSGEDVSGEKNISEETTHVDETHDDETHDDDTSSEEEVPQEQPAEATPQQDDAPMEAELLATTA